MSRYIDVDEEIRKINETIFEKERDGKADEFTTYCFKLFANALSKAPTADVEEIKHGKWIKDKRERRGDGEIYDYCCSLCKSPAVEGCYGNCDVLTPYCSQCGARMQKEKEE